MNHIFLRLPLTSFRDRFTTTDSNLIEAAGLWCATIGSVIGDVEESDDGDSKEGDIDQDDEWFQFKQDSALSFDQIKVVCRHYFESLVAGDDELYTIGGTDMLSQKQQQAQQQTIHPTSKFKPNPKGSRGSDPLVQLVSPHLHPHQQPASAKLVNLPTLQHIPFNNNNNATIFSKTINPPSLCPIPTEISQFDYSLGGGILTNQITEISGSSQLGKTQIGIQAALSAALPLKITPIINNIPLKYLTYHHQRLYPHLSDEIYNDYVLSNNNNNNNITEGNIDGPNGVQSLDDDLATSQHQLSPTLCLKVTGFVPQAASTTRSQWTRSTPTKPTHEALSFSTTNHHPHNKTTTADQHNTPCRPHNIDTYSIFVHTTPLDPNRFKSAAEIISKRSVLNHCLIDVYGVFMAQTEEYIIVPPKRSVPPPTFQIPGSNHCSDGFNTPSPDPFILSHFHYLSSITKRYNQLLPPAPRAANSLAPLDLNNPSHLPFIKQLFAATVSQFEWTDDAYCSLDLYHITNQQCCCTHRFKHSPTQLLHLINGTQTVDATNWERHLDPTAPECSCHGHLDMIPYPQLSPRALLRRCVLLHAPTLHSLLTTTSSVSATIGGSPSVPIPVSSIPCDFDTIDPSSNSSRVQTLATQRGYYPKAAFFPDPLHFTTPTIHPDSTLPTSQLMMLCIDNVATHFRGLDSAAEFMGGLASFVSSLHSIIQTKSPARNIAVLCINQVTTAFLNQSDPNVELGLGQSGSDPHDQAQTVTERVSNTNSYGENASQVPALGENWGSILHSRFFLHSKIVTLPTPHQFLRDPFGRGHPIQNQTQSVSSPSSRAQSHRMMATAKAISKITYAPPNLSFVPLSQSFGLNPLAIVYNIDPHHNFVSSMSQFNPVIPTRMDNKSVLALVTPIQLLPSAPLEQQPTTAPSPRAAILDSSHKASAHQITDQEDDDQDGLEVISVRRTRSSSRRNSKAKLPK